MEWFHNKIKELDQHFELSCDENAIEIDFMDNGLKINAVFGCVW